MPTTIHRLMSMLSDEVAEGQKFELNCPDGPVRLVDQTGFRLVDIKEIGEAIAVSLEAVCDEWRRVHG